MAQGDSYAVHEIMHTVHVFGETIGLQVLEHNSYNYIPSEAQFLIEQAVDSLHAAYQKIAEEAMDEDEED